jgi:hypothetical protein
MSYTNGLDNPELYFQTVTWTGNGSTNAITLDGDEDMQPDLVWGKDRTGTDNHHLFDSIRGTNQRIISNQTAAENTEVDCLNSFDTDGFTLGSNTGLNNNTDAHVAWCWKAGTAFSNDASATSIGSIDSSGSVSTDAGFSICSYTGNGTAGATIKHGLSKVPEMIIVKGRSANADNWRSYHKSLTDPTEDYLKLNTSDAETDGAASTWNSTAPTSSVFSVHADNSNNGSGRTYVGYCFHSVDGYSKVGSYTGNGNADGPFISTGHRVAWFMVKNTNGSNGWRMFDNKRLTYNPNNKILYANASDAEATTTHPLDFLSNGIKIRGQSSDFNENGDTYIYLAFAETPFKYSNAR